MRKFDFYMVFFFILLIVSAQSFAQLRSYYFVYGIKNAEYFLQNDSNRDYYIVLATFHNQSNAFQFCQSFKHSFVSTHVLFNQGFYRVVVGPLSTATEVRNMGKTLAGKTPLADAHRIKKPTRMIEYYQHRQPVYVQSRPLIQHVRESVLIGSKSSPSPQWSLTGSLGYTNYSNMYEQDGQTVLGRIAIGHALFTIDPSIFGLEIGAQSGNTMRLSVPQETLDELGGLPIQSTVKPMIDLLLTMQSRFIFLDPLFTQLKAGPVLRTWEFSDRNSVNNPSQLAGEIQAGIGYPIKGFASVDLLYQGIYGANPSFTVNVVQQTGHVHTLSVQNGILLGFSLHI